MARTLFDSETIFGIHEPGGEPHMLEAGRPGWVLFTEGIGHNREDHSGRDFSRISNQDLGVICRLNNGYEPAGTIPQSRYYADFAQRCANFVANSRGCKIWIIGNEMNFHVERPGITAAGLPAGSAPMQPQHLPLPEMQPTPAAQPNRPFFSAIFDWLARSVSGGMGAA